MIMVLASMSLWQSGQYIHKYTIGPVEAPLSSSSTSGDSNIDNIITPQLAELLHPLYNITFQGRAFLMTGHADDYMSEVHMSKGRF